MESLRQIGELRLVQDVPKVFATVSLSIKSQAVDFSLFMRR